MLEGQIVAAYSRRFLVELSDGRVVPCATRGRKSAAACGDRVVIQMTGSDQGVIDTIAPRQVLLFRSDAFREKLIAANVTQIVIVLAAVPSFYEELLSRCLIAAEASALKVLIVLNKCDLVPESAKVRTKLTLYENLGYPLLLLSAIQDVAPLRSWLHNETSVLVGQSGMGKSSIINALLPDIQVRTQEISIALNSGRHTTTHAQLYHLDKTSHLIDSPGLQEFGLHHLSRGYIEHAFVEFRPFIGHCRFNDCQHGVEPGCALLSAVTQGKISPHRLDTYRKIVSC